MATKTIIYTVQKGDTLHSIAKKKLGSSDRWREILEANKPTMFLKDNKPYIKTSDGKSHMMRWNPPDKIKIKVSTTSSSKKTNTKTNTVVSSNVATNVTLTMDSDGKIYARWNWSRANTKEYHYAWFYKNEGSSTYRLASTSSYETTTMKEVSYSPGDTCVSVQFNVIPIAKNQKVKTNSGTKDGPPYWTAEWCGRKTFSVKDNKKPAKPSAPSVTIEGTTITSTLNNIDTSGKYGATKINFEIYDAANKTGKASYACRNKPIVAKSATYVQTVKEVGKYKVRCQTVNKYGYTSEWSDYTDPSETAPKMDKNKINLTAKATTETQVYLSWKKVSGATGYTVQYATDKKYFNAGYSENVKEQSATSNSCYIDGLEAGTYFFRVKASNGTGDSAYCTPVQVTMGAKPSPPTTWSSSTTASIGETVILYWTHNSEDASKQQGAQLELTVNGKTSVKSIPYNADGISSYSIDTSSYTEDTEIKWKIQTKGAISTFSDWSIQRVINVYAKATLSLAVTDSSANALTTITSFPFYINGVAGPDSQTPIGYNISIISNNSYTTNDSIGNVKVVNEGEIIYSKYVDTTNDLLLELSAGNIDLENGISYTVNCTVSMNTGLTAEASVDFDVSWYEQKYIINADILFDPETVSASIRPYCEEPKTVYYKVEQQAVTLDDGTTDYNYVRSDETLGSYSIDYRQNYRLVTYDPEEGIYSIGSKINYSDINFSSSFKMEDVFTDSDITDASYPVYKGENTSGESIFYCLFENIPVDFEYTVPDSQGDSYQVYTAVSPSGETIFYCFTFAFYNKYFNVLYDSETETYTKGESINREDLTADGTALDYISTEEDEYGESYQVYKGEKLSGESIFYCIQEIDETYLATNVKLAVYRREFDGNFTEIGSNLSNTNNTFIIDPHPSLDYARYRIVATSEKTGAVSFYDMPGYYVGESAIIIQWDGQQSEFDFDYEDGGYPAEPALTTSMLRLPYNVDVSNNNSPDVELVEYVGRKHPVSYYGTQLGETATWNVEVIKDDKETLYALRRLAIWMGDVYVREPSGSGYWANITVSFSQKHCELTIPVTINITRVEGGM